MVAEVPSIGILVPATWQTTPASIHDGVVNLLVEDAHGPYFVSLIRDSDSWSELAIQPHEDTWHAVSSLGPTSPVERADGGPVVLPHGALSINDTHDPRVPPVRGVDLPPLGRSVLTECRRRMVASTGVETFAALLSPSVPENPFAGRARAILSAHEGGGTRSRDPMRAAVGLIGLGPGFTPAGDDFLSGVMLAYSMSTRHPIEPVLVDAVLRRLSKTTPGGASLLRLAIADLPPRYQIAIVHALSAGDVARALEIARAHGHSSGFDFLAGLLWQKGDIFDKWRRRV